LNRYFFWRHPERSRFSGGAKDLACVAATLTAKLTHYLDKILSGVFALAGYNQLRSGMC